MPTKIDLFDWSFGEYAIVIVPAETGVIYSNQTHGMMCNHPEIEGYIQSIFSIHGLDTCVGCSASRDLVYEIESRLDSEVVSDDEAWIVLADGRVVTTNNCD